MRGIRNKLTNRIPSTGQPELRANEFAGTISLSSGGSNHDSAVRLVSAIRISCSRSASNEQGKRPPSKRCGRSSHRLRVICLILLLTIAILSSSIRKLLGLTPKIVRKFKAGGVELEISSDAVNEIRSYLRESFDELVEKAKEEYQDMVRMQQITQRMRTVILDALPRVLTAHGITVAPRNVRSTIHVPDIVFRQYLYQLIDYFPKHAPGGSNRRFSQRFGIIGRSWRLGESMGRGNAVTAGPNAFRQMIEQWGFMPDEVNEASRSHPADLSIILRSEEEDNMQVGLIFIDATDQDAFGNDTIATTVATALENQDETKSLARALARGMVALRVAARDMDITRVPT